MATTRKAEETAYTAEECRAHYDACLEEALREPVKYIKHDTSSHDDEALYRLVQAWPDHMAAYGWWWLLKELLTARRDHSYDVSDDIGWRRLAHDMSCMCDMDADTCRLFVAELDHMGLINHDQLAEMDKVVINSVRVDAMSYAEGVAAKKLGAWKTNRKKLFA